MAGREIVNREVNIYIQSGQAQKAFDKLIAKEKELNLQLSKTTDPKKMASLRDQIQRLQEPIDRAAKKIKGQLEPSLRDTTSTVTRLRNELKLMSESDPQYAKKVQMYQQANRELDLQKQKVGFLSRAWKSFWQEAKTVAVGVIIGNTIQSALQTVLGYVTGIVTGSAKIADELADIEKTTGLTNQQVRELNKELGKIDTRTSRSELRKLATEGGKLGFETAPELLKFVDAADKIKVALGEDLGENAIIDTAKAAKIFGVEMLNVASAINEIGANSAASEPFAIDFLKRLAGVAPTVKLSADQVLGFGAALEIAGQTTEVSSTALNTFFLDFVANADKFGKAAGFAKGELGKLINEQGTNEGFLQFLERLRAANPSADAFIKKLRDLGIDGARGSNVMLALANNIKTVREQQGIANKAIQSNSSIMDEFNKKNNNAAASLDKFRKNVAGLFQSEGFQRAGENAIAVMNSFVNLLKASFRFIKEHGGLVATLGTIYLLLATRIKGATLAQTAHNLVTKAGAIITNTISAAQAFYIALTQRTTASLTLLRRAQMAWNAAASLGAGPLGLLIAGIGALIIGIGKLFNRTKQLTAEQRLQNELAKKTNDLLGDQVAEVEVLTKLAADENAELANRQKAIEDLIKINPAFADTLRINAQGHLEGAEAIAAYVQQLKLQTEAEARRLLLIDKTKQKNDQFNTIRNAIGLPNISDEDLEQLLRGQASRRTNIFSSIGTEIQKGVSKEVVGLLDQINRLQTDIATSAQQSKDALKTVGDTANTSADLVSGAADDTTKSTKKTKDALAELMKELEKIKTELRLSQLTPLQRELAELDIKYNALKVRAGKNTKLLLVIEQLYQEERIQLIQRYAAAEVAEWNKAQDKLAKNVADQVDKNIKGLADLDKRLQEEIEKRLEEYGRDRLAGKEYDFIKARGRQKLQAELEFLNEQRKQELSNKELTENEKLLIEEKYRQKSKEAQTNHLIDIIQTSAYFLQELANIDAIFSNARSDREYQELETDRIINDTKRRRLESRLKAGTISQLQYQRELDKMELQREKKEKEFRKRQFERDKRAQYAAALISNAGAVSTTLQKFGPPIPPNFLGIAAMGLTIITGLAQLVTIARTKAPEYGRGGKLSGRYHSQGGNPILDGSGRKIGEIEKDEGIINRFSMGDKKRYTATGTVSEIASTLNGLHGGHRWDNRAVLRPAWSTAKPVGMNFQNIHRYFASGGRFPDTSSDTSQAPVTDPHMMAILERTYDLLNDLKVNGIKAYSLITETEKQEARLNAIRNDASMQ